MVRVRSALLSTLAAVVVAAAVYAFFGHAFLNYDSFYTLTWGRDLLHGINPQYQVSVAPTPHPLSMGIGALVSPLGDGAEDAMLALGLLAIGFLVVGVFRLGQVSYAWPVGVLAAAIVATRVPLLNFGIRGYVDLPAIAFIVWAAAIEARRPRSGVPVLLLLGLAGLLRPEAWLYIGAYWLWLVWPLPWRDRIGYALLAAAAPTIWLLSDLAITGDALWSFHGTRDLAADLQRKTGLGAVPEVMPRRLGEILRLPELIAAVIGFTAGLVWMRKRTLLPAAVAVLNGLAYLVFAAGHLPLLGRYLFLAAAMLALFAAVAALGWSALPGEDPKRRAWLAGGVVILIGMAAFVPSQVDRLSALRDDIAARDRVQADLLDLVRSPAAHAPLEHCGTVYVPNHRPVPELAYWLDRRPEEIVSAQLKRPGPQGLFLEPANERVKQLSILDPKDPKRLDARVPPGYTRAASNRSWRLYSGACG